MKKRLNLLAFVIFVLLVAWVFMFSAETKRKIQRPILSLFGLVSKASYSLTVDEDLVNGVNIGPDALADKYTEEELAQRYSLLLREVMELRAIKSQFAQMQRDNLKLRQSLGFSQDFNVDSQRLIPARVIKRESSTWWNDVWINKGEKSGFALDSAVLTTTLDQRGSVSPALVGKVTALSGNTARVLLLTDERCKVAAKVEGSRESGLLMGSRTQGGTPILKLRYLSKNTDQVKAGYKVYSSQAGGVVPVNILLGTVTKFEKLEFYGEATVEPAVDFAQLTDVFVIEPLSGEDVMNAAEEADAAAAMRAGLAPSETESTTPPAGNPPTGERAGAEDEPPPSARRAIPVPVPRAEEVVPPADDPDDPDDPDASDDPEGCES